MDKYTKEELEAAVRPIDSVISKCEKALSKSTEESPTYKRISSIIKAMEISTSLIKDKIKKKLICR